jgi:hypothetical protein
VSPPQRRRRRPPCLCIDTLEHATLVAPRKSGRENLGSTASRVQRHADMISSLDPSRATERIASNALQRVTVSRHLDTHREWTAAPGALTLGDSPGARGRGTAARRPAGGDMTLQLLAHHVMEAQQLYRSPEALRRLRRYEQRFMPHAYRHERGAGVVEERPHARNIAQAHGVKEGLEILEQLEQASRTQVEHESISTGRGSNAA